MSDADDRSIARRTLIVIGLVLATVVGLALLRVTRLVVTWMVIAAFFAVALNPLVDWVQRRLVRHRAAATLIVFLATFVALCALGALIVVPLVDEVARFADRAPDLLRETEAGRGPLGELLDRLRLRQYIETHADQFRLPGRGAAQLPASAVAGLTCGGLLAAALPGSAARRDRTRRP